MKRKGNKQVWQGCLTKKAAHWVEVDKYMAKKEKIDNAINGIIFGILVGGFIGVLYLVLPLVF